VIRSGTVLCHGSREEVLSNPEARKYYFGEGMEVNLSPPPPHRAPPTTVSRRRNLDDTDDVGITRD
jgi:hypothetical protein